MRKPKATNQVPESCLSTAASLLAQATEATAAGLQASHPVTAQQPRGQVLGDGGYRGNAAKTKHVLARHADTGELTATAPQSHHRGAGKGVGRCLWNTFQVVLVSDEVETSHLPFAAV